MTVRDVRLVGKQLFATLAPGERATLPTNVRLGTKGEPQVWRIAGVPAGPALRPVTHT